MALDVYLSAATRRLSWLRGMRRLTRPLRGYYARKYSGRDDRMVTIADYDGGTKISIDRSTYMGGSIYWHRYHHLGELRYLRAHLEPQMTFADVGANQGEFTLPVAKRLSAGQVLAFEPEDRMFLMLRENVALNDLTNVRLFHFGLGKEPSRTALYTSTGTTTQVGWNEGLFTTFNDGVCSAFVQEIEIRSLDDVVSETPVERLDYMKIDVEGAELFVLEGAIKTLQRFRPRLIMEISAETFSTAGYSTRDLLRFLTGQGYQFRHVCRNGTTREASEEAIVGDPRTLNILCEPR